MKRVAIIQSNYIPWKGYFDIINDVDLFIFYDDVQYTTRDWRNRNIIKTPQGDRWLSIPVGAKIHRPICEVKMNDQSWQKRHWRTICQNYSRAPYFPDYKAFIQAYYLDRAWEYLSDLNQFLIKHIAQDFLKIKTEFMDSRELKTYGSRQERLIHLLKASEADVYVSGPAARDYIDEMTWAESGIQLCYKKYDGYPQYPQLYPPFNHFVSILDLLFNVGVEASYYIWGWRKDGC